jgi:pimeloyl-ACP methyl ester carboxylesterase
VITTRSIDYPASERVRTGTLYQTDDGVARPALVVQHGLLVSRDFDPIERLCRALADSFDVIAVDLRGHGNAPGWFTWGREEHNDLADLVSFLHSLHPAVGLLGFSIGGYTAILSAALARERDDLARPDALCTVGAPAHLDLWRYRFRLGGFLPQARKILARRGRFMRPSLRGVRWTRALDVVGQVSPIPLFIVHGDADWLVHPDHARRLYDAAAPPRELLMIEGGSHAEYIIENDIDSLRGPVHAFFSRTLLERGRDEKNAAGREDVSEVRVNPDRR